MAKQICEAPENWGIKDNPKVVIPYEQQIDSTGVIYTAPENGYYIGMFRIGNMSTLNIKINNTGICNIFSADMTSAIQRVNCPIFYTGFIPLRKGDVLTVKCTFGQYVWNDTSIFMPLNQF